MRFEQAIWFRGINTSDCKRKVSGFQQPLTCSCRQKLEELLNLEHIDKGDERFFQDGGRRTAGGVGKRLRWAQSGPERGGGSPGAGNTHSHKHFSTSHS